MPESCIKPGLKIPTKVYELIGNGRRFRGPIVLGVRDVSRRLEFESSYTLTQHAPGDSILTEILPQTIERITKVSNAVGEGQYEELLELIGHSPAKMQAGALSMKEEEEVDTIQGLLLADRSGHIAKNPWVNAQLDKLLARWTFKACTGGAFRLPAFALADDGFLVAANGRVIHGSDWISQDDSISTLQSDRGLCVRYPIRAFGDLLPTKHLSRSSLLLLLQIELEKKGCPDAATMAERIANDQIQLEGTYVLHSETAKKNGGDYDFDLVAVIEDGRFPLWVDARFNWTKHVQLAKNKASKAKHPWWNIVHVARKAVGNQIGSITDLITSCMAEDRQDLAEQLVAELQNALDNLKWGVEPDQEKINTIRKQVTPAPWLRHKRERRVSHLPLHLDVKSTDRIGILWNHVRPHFEELLTQREPLDAFIGLIDGENVTDQMLEECHYVHSAYGCVMRTIAERQEGLRKAKQEAEETYDKDRNNNDKKVRDAARISRNQARSAYYFDQERAKDERKAISNFVKVWTQNKTQDRMAWAQALNSIVCKGKSSTGSLIWLAFPQELVTRLAELTGGKNVRVYQPKLVEGWVRKDEHGRAFLVEAVRGGLKETFLFTCRDGQVTLDDTPPPEKPKASTEADKPAQPTETAPLDDGVGHDIPDETEESVDYEVEGIENDVPF